MSLKKDFYKLSSVEFDKKKKSIYDNESTIKIFENPSYYFLETQEYRKLLLDTVELQNKFDQLFFYFSDFGRNQLVQGFLLDEIEATNKIENINSTRHDIYHIMKNDNVKKNKYITSIVKTYTKLTEGGIKIDSFEIIKEIYDELIMDSLDSKDKPDEEIFRKGTVCISNGNNSIHDGFYPETKVIEGMKEFIKIYNLDIDTYTKMILSHFVLETIHPFYDGNGRLGRYLMSNILFYEKGSFSAFTISSIISDRKAKYYKAFKEAKDVHSFGDLSLYMELMIKIIHDGLSDKIKELEEKKKNINVLSINDDFTKSEVIIYKLLLESTYLSSYGLSNQEIVKYTNISERTVNYTIKKFKEMSILEETSIGKYIYRKITI